MDAIEPPKIDTLKRIAEKLETKCSNQQLLEFVECCKELCVRYKRLTELPDISLSMNRTMLEGFRPNVEENGHNAWYYKCKKTKCVDGKLSDKRIAIKDNIAIAGIPMMMGSHLMEGYTPDYNATVVSRIIDEGGVIAGNATCESFCITGVSYETSYGPVVNPHNPLMSAGGSSSGCAVLVATREVDMAVGSDQGGSIRHPSSDCGIVGMKPTYGLVPYTGAIIGEPTLDHLGPMARSVSDCALLLEIIAGCDKMDNRQPNQKPVLYTKMLSLPVSHLKLGILKEGFRRCSVAVTARVRDAIKLIQTSHPFGKIEEMSIPLHDSAEAIMTPVMTEGLTLSLIESYGSPMNNKGFTPTSMTNAIFHALRSNPKDIPPTLKKIILWSTFIRKWYGNNFLAKSRNWIIELSRAYDIALTEYDALLMPTLPATACRLPTAETTLEEYIMRSIDPLPNTAPLNATGHPALTIPVGLDAVDNMPVGMSIVGKRFGDDTVLRIGKVLESLLAEAT